MCAVEVVRRRCGVSRTAYPWFEIRSDEWIFRTVSCCVALAFPLVSLSINYEYIVHTIACTETSSALGIFKVAATKNYALNL